MGMWAREWLPVCKRDHAVQGQDSYRDDPPAGYYQPGDRKQEQEEFRRWHQDQQADRTVSVHASGQEKERQGWLQDCSIHSGCGPEECKTDALPSWRCIRPW